MSRREVTFRGVAIFAAAWQGLWLIGDANLRRIVVSNPWDPAVVLLILSMVAWLVLWPSLFGPVRNLRRVRILQVLSMVFVVAAGLVLLTQTTAVGEDGWFVGASVLNLGAGLAGLYLYRRSGVLVVLSIVALEATVVSFVHARGEDVWPLEVDLVYPFYALALGLASVAARHALLESASRQDIAQRLLNRQYQVRADNELTGASLTSAETRLHETVLNTLTAIVRGGLSQDGLTRERLRERAREAADVLRSIAQGSNVAARWDGDLRVDLAGTLVDLEDNSIAVHLDGVLDLVTLEGQIDEATFAVVGSAVREALINVLRHSGADSVRVSGDVRRSADGTWWRIRVRDDGRGFDTSTKGFGLRTVIGQGVSDCGGRVSIKSGNGTSITMEIPVAAFPTSAGATTSGTLRAITVPVVAAFTFFTLYTIGATWQYAGSAVANALTVAVFMSLVVLLLLAAGDGSRVLLPWWAVTAVLIGVPVMTTIERFVAATPNPTGDWTSEAGSALMFVIVASGPLWAAPAAAVSWFIAQELAWIELTQPGMFVIVVATLLGWQLRKGQARTRDMDVEATEQRSALAASQLRLVQARSRYQDVDTSGLIALLDDIAGGRVEPQDDHVRAACAREERMIRSVLHLHPEEIGVHRDLVALASVARDVDVDLSISVVDGLSSRSRLAYIEDARMVISLAQARSQARATITRDKQGCVFRLVAEVDPAVLNSLPRSVEVLDEQTGLVSLEEACGISETSPTASVVTADAQRSAHV